MCVFNMYRFVGRKTKNSALGYSYGSSQNHLTATLFIFNLYIYVQTSKLEYLSTEANKVHYS